MGMLCVHFNNPYISDHQGYFEIPASAIIGILI